MLPQDSIVEKRRKEMEQGSGEWVGWDKCYDKLKLAAVHLSTSPHTRFGEDHINIMAAMGCGHEETMKYFVSLSYTYGWI